MAFIKHSIVIIFSLILLGSIHAQDITLELQMPGTMFEPGSTFSLDLRVTNTGPALNTAQLFVALTIGTGDFWFFPTWNHYPPDIDWDTVDVPASVSDNWEILPMFSWPSGAGAFDGAMFFAAILHNGVLMSNLADVTFGWRPTTDAILGNMHYIPAGTFTQGSPSGEPCRSSGLHENQFTHNLTRDLFVMETEVTRQMWSDLRAVQSSLPVDPSHSNTSPTLSHPVQQTTWYECVLFANLLSIQNGYTPCYYTNTVFTTPIDASNYTSGPFYCDFDADGYRLATEGEWEYFTRAGTTTPFSCNEMRYGESNCYSAAAGTHPTLEQYCVYVANEQGGAGLAGAKLANPWNLKDVHGNVGEWCWDYYELYPTGSVTDYRGPTSGGSRVTRGGTFVNLANICRSAYRFPGNPNERNFHQGFRLLRDAQ